MKTVYNTLSYFFFRLYFPYSLIFFVCICVPSCKQKTEAINFVWDNNQATAILIPRHFTHDNIDTIKTWLKVTVEKSDTIPMLGEVSIKDDDVLFKPLIPFTRGLGYEVYFRNKLIGKIKVPSADSTEAPVVLNVYPGQDTLPENLLKFYLQFSAPMREGESQKYIALLDKKGDTIPGVFLDLQPELWNEDGTVLTVWLDPGRIKRDLVPNQKMGNPLQNGNQYTLQISTEWKDTKGLKLKQSFNKIFYADARDSISPDVASWKLNIVSSQTTGPLEIDFGESLDHYLLLETIKVVDENKNNIPGEIRVNDFETGIRFIPAAEWKKGKYILQVQSILEDLAGNNLNKLFDRDILVKKIREDKNIAERIFTVK